MAKKLRKDMTLGEVLLWNEIKGNQLGFRFSRQIPIDEFIVDFYCKDLMLAIEVDGSTHYHKHHPEKDEERQLRLESLGVHFLRFDDLDVKTNIGGV
ncbi:endonuclease domain-containing protein [Ekhidna sp.]|uniref:endonuclease domain-containing protein n=1 Tax=Ekhidna sp. TaxID=2608089 RepID=UPI003C7C315F